MAGRSPTCSLQRLGRRAPTCTEPSRAHSKSADGSVAAGLIGFPRAQARTPDQILDTGWPSHGSTIADGELPLVTSSVGFLNLVSLVRFQPGAPEVPARGDFHLCGSCTKLPHRQNCRHFADATGGDGTTLAVTAEYGLPAGLLVCGRRGYRGHGLQRASAQGAIDRTIGRPPPVAR